MVQTVQQSIVANTTALICAALSGHTVCNRIKLNPIRQKGQIIAPFFIAPSYQDVFPQKCQESQGTDFRLRQDLTVKNDPFTWYFSLN